MENTNSDYKFDTSSFVSETFGYYTNGYQIEEKIIIIFEMDSIRYDTELKDY